MTRRLEVIIDGEFRSLRAVEDTTGDGHPDSATVHWRGDEYRFTDLDGDGYPDIIRVVRADGSRRILGRLVDSDDFRVLADCTAHDDSIEENASHWFAQATPHTCGPAAITMVLADLFDLRLPDERVVWERAVELDAMTPLGMPAKDLERVITSYGIPARTVQTNSRELERLLERGHEVILMVDAHEYWPGMDGRGEADELRKMPHAVRILGIDVEAGLAVLSDSGRDHPLFRRLEVPLDALEDAWADLEWLAVVTEVTHAQVRYQQVNEGIDPELLGHHRVVDASGDAVAGRSTLFLPFTVRLQRLVDRVRRSSRRSR